MSEYSNEMWNQYTDDNENKLQVDLSQFIYNTCITLDNCKGLVLLVVCIFIYFGLSILLNSSDQKINVIFLVHRSNSSFWKELMKSLLKKFFELSAF